MMKLVVTLLSLMLVDGVQAQENKLSLKDAQRYAKLCVEQMGTIDGPIKIQPEVMKPCATHGEGGGAMVIPDRRLQLKSLEQKKKIIPVGQIWLRKWVPVVNGKAVPRSKLRMMKINIDDKERPMPLLLLALQQGEKTAELLVYSQGDKKLQTIPLKRTDFIQELPLELEWQRGEKKNDRLILTIFGKLECVLPITRE